MPHERRPRLQIDELSRHFPGVLALDRVSFDVAPGEVHALVGENGAGKSTLINILAGVLTPSHGRILVDGEPVSFHDPNASQAAGISVIFQEFNLLPDLSVAENVFIGREPRRGLRIDWPEMHRHTREVLAQLRLEIDSAVPVAQLSVGQQQLIEIARALSVRARVIIMDEPTAALNEREVIRLLELVRALADGGVSVIYVSHRLNEVFSVADRITVLRDGRHVSTSVRSATTERAVVAAMVGRELAVSTKPARHSGKVVLQVSDLSVEGDGARNVSFNLRSGEVLALAGLMGSGCSEVVEALFGLRRIAGGTVTFRGKAYAPSNPRAAIRSGIGLVPEDRKRSGIFPDLSVVHNLSIGALPQWLPGLLRLSVEQRTTIDYRSKLNIRFSRPEQRILGLSGGNQQKVVLARALEEKCRILLLAEPTRGVDVGAKAEIYALVDRLIESGIGILLLTSELPELIRLADRCVVLAAGTVRGELAGEAVTQEAVMELATGMTGRHAPHSSHQP
jgi:ABC-type sugar transport system ATPase subunit